MIDKKEFERAKKILLELRDGSMTVNQLDSAIEMIEKLKIKLSAVQTGQYFDFKLSEQQKNELIEEIKILKTTLQQMAAEMDIGIGG